MPLTELIMVQHINYLKVVLKGQELVSLVNTIFLFLIKAFDLCLKHDSVTRKLQDCNKKTPTYDNS